MKICISSESTIDLPVELLEKYNIKTVPFTVRFGDKEALDGTIAPQEIFDYVDATGELPQTSAVNEIQYEEHFKKLLEEYDEVIHIAFNSELSCACGNAMRVASEMEHVHVIDSRSLCTAIGCLCIYANKLVNEGKSVEEIVKAVEARVPYCEVSLVVSTVDYLHKGGRCSALVKHLASLLRLRPQIVVRDGKLHVGDKYIGKQSVYVKQYCKSIFEEFNNPDLSVGFVTHSNASPEMVEVAVQMMKERGFKEVIVTTAGCTISCHAGPKALGILYLNDGEH